MFEERGRKTSNDSLGYNEKSFHFLPSILMIKSAYCSFTVLLFVVCFSFLLM